MAKKHGLNHKPQAAAKRQYRKGNIVFDLYSDVEYAEPVKIIGWRKSKRDGSFCYRVTEYNGNKYDEFQDHIGTWEEYKAFHLQRYRSEARRGIKELNNTKKPKFKMMTAKAIKEQRAIRKGQEERGELVGTTTIPYGVSMKVDDKKTEVKQDGES